MANSQIDLSQLAIDRSSDASPASNPARVRWLTRYVLPLGILLGFIGLLGAAAGRQWMPATPVTVVPVIVKRATIQQAGTPLFQAPGWIEPRPTAISVAALAPGVIEELLVVEGQQLQKDSPIARLISIDAELLVQHAKNGLAIREGELDQAQAELAGATIRLENPVHLQVQLADAQSSLANAKTELAKLPFQITETEARVSFALSSMEGKRAARGAISDRVIARAESEYAVATAKLQEIRNREPNLQREIDALSQKVRAIEQQIKLLVDERRQFEEAKAKLHSAIAKRDEAKLQLRQAELTLKRNVIRAPIDGRVLRLIAAPGTRVMGQVGASSHGSGAVIEMYDPNRLQVRVDVRLEDVPMVIRGQSVEIKTASTDGVILGRVLQLTSAANIQKNTLEVKVELIKPPSNVRPDMLVSASFLAPTIENSNMESTEAERMLVPAQLVQSGDSGSFVWIVDENQTAQRTSVEPGNPFDGGLIEIKRGLNATDKLIVEGIAGLRQGSAVAITGDDPNLGVN